MVKKIKVKIMNNGVWSNVLKIKTNFKSYYANELEYDIINQEIKENYIWESPKTIWDQGLIDFNIYKPNIDILSIDDNILFIFGTLKLYLIFKSNNYYIKINTTILENNPLFLDSNKNNIKIYYNKNENYTITDKNGINIEVNKNNILFFVNNSKNNSNQIDLNNLNIGGKLIFTENSKKHYLVYPGSKLTDFSIYPYYNLNGSTDDISLHESLYNKGGIQRGRWC